MSRHSFFVRCAALIAPFLLLVTQSASAVNFTVGNDSAHCSHSTLQAALDAVPANSSGNTIHVVTGTYSQVHLTMDDVNVAITGGYSSCSATTPTSTTTLDGAGNGSNSVVHTDGTTILSLTNFVVQNGTQGSSSHGGGIYVNGGRLTLTNVTVTHNTCGYGGGINVHGDGQTFVDIDAGSSITNNSVTHDGGGIRIEGDTVLTIAQGNTLIANNQAATGGGLSIIGPARADISSPGRGTQGLFYQNLVSGNGGAIAVYGSPSNGDPALLRVFATVAATPPKFNDNQSQGAGAAVYLQSHGMTQSHAYLCAQDFDFENNIGDDGTALFADASDNGDHTGSNIYLNQIDDPDHICLAPGSMFDAIHCTPGTASCNVIKNNHALIGSGAGTPTDGAVVSIVEGGVLKQSNVRYTNNIGGYVLRFKNNEGDVSSTTSCLIGSNSASSNVIKSEGNSPISINFCTIANNNPGTATVMQLDDDYDIENSILWQPGGFSQITETDSNSTIVTHNIISDDIFGLTEDVTAKTVTDVLFVDEAHGDYHLQPASPAVDFAPSAITDVDLDGLPRVVDLPIVPNYLGAVDLGPFELQGVDNLVLNPNFDTDLRLWTNLDPREVSFDSTQSVAGATPSGSVHIVYMPENGGGGGGSGPSTLQSLSQCVHVPAFGEYAITGYGRMFGTNLLNASSFITLQEFDNSDDCSGTADHEDTQYYPHSNPIAWAHPSGPTIVQIGSGAKQKFQYAAVLITLGFSPTGSIDATSFDGISLSPTTGDTIFADDFGN